MAFQVDLSPLERMSVRQGQALGGLGSVVGEALGSREKRIREDQEQKDLQQLMTRAYEGDEEAIKGVFSKSPQLGLQLEQLERDRQARYGQEQKKILDENNLKYARQLKFAKTPEDKFSIKMTAIEDPNSDLFDQEDLDQPIELAEFDANVLLFDKLGDKGYEALLGEKETEFQQGTGEMSGYAFNPSTGEFSIDDKTKQRLSDLKAKSQTENLNAKDRQSINKDISKFVDQASDIATAAKDLSVLKKVGGGPSAIAAVFKFMKVLDPGSVVKEDEFATAENSSGALQGMWNIFNKLQNGERLGEQQYDQFISTAQGLANNAIASAGDDVNKYLDTFEDTLTPAFKDLIQKRVPDLFEVQQQVTKKSKSTIQAPQAAIDYLKQNPGHIEQFKAKYGYTPEGY